MNQVNRRSNKIIELGSAFPEHVVVTREWLAEQGFEDDRLSRYVSSGYLSRVGRGLYAKPLGATSWDSRHSALSSSPSWKVALNSALLTARHPIAVAGYSALWVRNLAHYVSDHQDSTITVTSPETIPKWMSSMVSVAWNRINSRKLFNGQAGDLESCRLFGLDQKLIEKELDGTGIEAYGYGETQSWCLVSSPERALIEWANDLKEINDWYHFMEVVEGIGTLRPGRLVGLLTACKSIKAKRILLWAARESGANWYKPVANKITLVDLGTGVRQLVKGGTYDKEFKITVTTLSRP